MQKFQSNQNLMFTAPETYPSMFSDEFDFDELENCKHWFENFVH